MIYNFENEYKNLGYNKIVGIDEVGRGCLFGDVLACAIIMPLNHRIDGVTDSKKLTPQKREDLYDKILEESVAVGIGRVDSKTIDEINIRKATHLAMIKAVENLIDKQNKKIIADLLLIDAEKINIDIEQVAIIKGDEKCYSISCASIIAKVYRDRLCIEWSKKFPNYSLEKHKGYATKEHRELIKKFGETEMHRKSFLKNMDNW